MKTNNIYISVICLMAVFSFLFVSCDNGDTTKPVIDWEEPVDGDTLQIGNEHGVHFEAEFSDNEALASYRINIHDNFDDHGSHRSSTLEVDPVPFAFDSIWVISGKNFPVHHHDIFIPKTDKDGRAYAEGNYHFIVYCVDAAGNVSLVGRDVVLSHEAGEHHDDDEEGHDHED
ncbi:MAG: DUF4625 domain-containing protein [Dysgonamonadaceae bacterium]|jgi:hypothetical protein|nr:DUF4625 domain-containing protein [Dysgonamonadaceae bacterium]